MALRALPSAEAPFRGRQRGAPGRSLLQGERVIRINRPQQPLRQRLELCQGGAIDHAARPVCVASRTH